MCLLQASGFLDCVSPSRTPSRKQTPEEKQQSEKSKTGQKDATLAPPYESAGMVLDRTADAHDGLTLDRTTGEC
jgi:hypothetical protein